MASSGKKKTTMATLERERRMRERRMDKQARKDARKALAGLSPEMRAEHDAREAAAAAAAADERDAPVIATV
jgi:hypothetical protein